MTSIVIFDMFKKLIVHAFAGLTLCLGNILTPVARIHEQNEGTASFVRLII